MLNKFKEVVPPLAIVPEVADIAETASTQLTPLLVLSCHLYLTVPVAPFLSTALEVKVGLKVSQVVWLCGCCVISISSTG